MSGHKKRKGRALLVASVGVAVAAFGCKNEPPAMGNLRPVEVFRDAAGPNATPTIDTSVPNDAGAQADASALPPKVLPKVPPEPVDMPVGNLRPVEVPPVKSHRPTK
jgi:hypothetical protein